MAGECGPAPAPPSEDDAIRVGASTRCEPTWGVKGAKGKVGGVVVAGTSAGSGEGGRDSEKRGKEGGMRVGGRVIEERLSVSAIG